MGYGVHRLRGLLGLSALAAAAPVDAAPQSATANVVTLRPLSIVKIADLDFGSAIAGATAGTIVVNPFTDARTTTGGTTAFGGAAQSAQFYTYGGPLQVVSVTRGALPVLSRSGGGATMNVTQLTLNGPITRLLTSAGLLDLRVGGTLEVAANQLEGSYSGTFNITVTYF